MKSIDVFLEGAIKPPESKMVDEYKTALKDSDQAAQTLMRFLRVRDGKPVFLDGVESVQSQIECADERLRTTKADIREYLDALGDYESVTQMVETNNRHRRALDNVERDCKNILERAIKASGLAPERAQEAPEVQQSLDKRDRMRSELEPVLKDLSERINRAKKVVGRY